MSLNNTLNEVMFPFNDCIFKIASLPLGWLQGCSAALQNYSKTEEIIAQLKNQSLPVGTLEEWLGELLPLIV
jgi:hypothetical protein